MATYAFMQGRPMRTSSDWTLYIGIEINQFSAVRFTLTYNYNFCSCQIPHSATSKILSCPFSHLAGYHVISILDCSTLNWDHGRVDCGTNILCGCWLYWQKEIQVYCRASSNIVAGKKIRGTGVTSHHFIWLLSIKLGLWSCRLWYQHP
jgi:hypothetical protein